MDVDYVVKIHHKLGYDITPLWRDIGTDVRIWINFGAADCLTNCVR